MTGEGLITEQNQGFARKGKGEQTQLVGNQGFPGGAIVKNPPANVEDTGNMDLIPGLGRSLGEGNGNPL